MGGVWAAVTPVRRWRAGTLTGAVVLLVTAATTAQAATRANPVVQRTVPRTAAAGTISTVAGGVGGPAKATRVPLFSPCGLAYIGGNVYVADSEVVRKVNPQSDWLTNLAGNAAPVSPLGDGGPAAAASLEGACSVVTDHFGNVLIGDQFHARVRMAVARTGTYFGRKFTAGNIYTVAGNGHLGFAGDGGPAIHARVGRVTGVALDGAGNLVVVSLNRRVRVVAAHTGTFYGQAMTIGDIYTVAGTDGPGFAGDGGPATAAQFNNLQALSIDAHGNLLVADQLNDRVRVVAEQTGTFYAQAMTAGDIYTVAGDGTFGFAGDDGPATSAELNFPQGVVTDSAGNLLVADIHNNRVRVVAGSTGMFYGQAMTEGDIYTIAGNGTAGFTGDGGPAAGAELSGPSGAAVDGAGNVLVADQGNLRVRVVAASTGTFYGQAMTRGDIYTVAGDPTGTGDGGPATSATLEHPTSMATDSAGDLFVGDGDSNFNQVRMVAGSTGSFFGKAMIKGHIYTVAGDGADNSSCPRANGGPATRFHLAFLGRVGLDNSGNLVFPDCAQVQVVAAQDGTFYGQAMTAGHIYTVAGDGLRGSSGNGGPATSAEFDFAEGGVGFISGAVTADLAGNLVITDTGNNWLRVVAAHTGTFYSQAMTKGDIYAVAGNGTPGFAGDGGPASAAELNSPDAVALDSAGNLVVADNGNNRIRVVAASTGAFYGQAMTKGDIYTVAGNGSQTFSGDGGPATAAGVASPSGTAVDSAGNLAVLDINDFRVRVVAASTGAFYGQAMTRGDIYTVAGNGIPGFAGDGGPATSAELDFQDIVGAALPSAGGVATDRAGNLLIADCFNARVREVAGWSSGQSAAAPAWPPPRRST
ncbi:MAG TPA: hypothetical protein VGS19_10495 [Streptosporangiaceae bacterium]|nr:hypothetical protein [Streptosporangiaceae bacterium]